MKISFQQIVKEAETKFEETINLQEQLYSIEAENIENVKKYIISSSFLSNRESFSVLLRCIDGAISSRPLSFPYYLDIIQSISDQIRSNFTSYELFTDLIQNNYLRFKLYELGFIKLSTVLFYLKKNSNDLKLFFIFAFEVKSHDPFLYQSYTSQSSDFREYLSHVNSEEHSILRTNGLNSEKVALLIRSNDAIEFQRLHSLTNFSVDMKVNSNYENRQFSEETLSLIEYSALFGSVEVFKYLLLNGATITKNLPKYAVTGGSYEIIHILEQKGSKFDNDDSLNAAIYHRRNEIVNYIVDTLDIDYSIEALRTSLKVYNLPIFFDILKKVDEAPVFEKPKMNLITYSVQCGYVDIVRCFSKLIENSDEKNRLLGVAVNFRRFDVFKYLHSSLINEDNVKPNNNELILKAAAVGHKTVLEYLLKFIDQNCFEIRNTEKNSILSLASSYGELENVEFIVSLKPTAEQLNNRNVYGV